MQSTTTPKSNPVSVKEYVKENFNINTKFYDCINDITDQKKAINIEVRETANENLIRIHDGRKSPKYAESA